MQIVSAHILPCAALDSPLRELAKPPRRLGKKVVQGLHSGTKCPNAPTPLFSEPLEGIPRHVSTTPWRVVVCGIKYLEPEPANQMKKRAASQATRSTNFPKQC